MYRALLDYWPTNDSGLSSRGVWSEGGSEGNPGRITDTGDVLVLWTENK